MARKKRKAAPWAYSTGEEPHTVYVFERYPGSMLYIQAWNPVTKKRPKKSLGHKDRERAKTEALVLHQMLVKGAPMAHEPATVGAVLAAYLTHRTPKKAKAQQPEDRRRAALWNRVLGPRRKVDSLGRAEWESFIDQRSTGAIDATGKAITYVGDGPRISVAPRTVDADLVFINAVFNWARSWNGPDGRPLLERNPWGAVAPGVKRTLVRPKAAAIARPVASYDRYLTLLAVADRVLMECRKDTPGAVLVEVGRAQYRLGEGPVMKWMTPSYFRDLLELAESSGRRISAICRLTYDRLRWERGEIVQVQWPPLKGETEKWVTISNDTRATLKRIVTARPGVGARWMFPSPRKSAQPITKRLAFDWMQRAEALAGLPHLPQGAWHPYRRKWATERKHHPTADVMAVGGWTDDRSLKESYQHADDETMEAVVNEPRKLRERKA